MKKNLELLGVWDNYTLKKASRIMRCTLIFLFAFTLHLMASESYSQKVKISLASKSASLESVLDEIEKQSDYVFLFSKEVVDVTKPIAISVKDENIEDVLDVLFESGKVDYKIIENKIILSSRTNDRFVQQDNKVKVTGMVTDDKGEPLPGVNVFEKSNPTNGVITGIDGSYTINVSSSDAVLTFSFIGFDSQELNVAGRSQVNVTLAEEFTQVGEVMVVAYGTAKKETFTGSAEVVKKEDLVKTSSNSVSKALLGRVAGVQVASYSAAAGAGADIRIRGVGSANAGSAPLYVVDGVAGAPIPTNDDIETFVVLKDAAAASLYGSRAANGVIVITTKRGKGDTSVNVKYNKTLGWRSKSKFELMNANEFMSKAWEGLYNERKYFPKDVGNSDQRSPERYAHEELMNTVGYNPYFTEVNGKKVAYDQPFDNNGNLKSDARLLYDNDWMDAVYRTSNINDFHVSVSRGGDNGNVYTSLSYYDQKGILIGNDYKRLNYTLNASNKIGESIEFGLRSNAKYFEGRENRDLWDVYTFNNATPIYERAGITTGDYDAAKYGYGDILRDANGKKTYHWNESYYGKEKNPLAEVDTYDEGYDGINVFVSPFITIEPFEGMTLNGNASANFTKRSESYFYHPMHGAGVSEKGYGEKYEKSWRTLSAFVQAAYQKHFGNHDFKVMGVYEVEEYEYKTVSASGKSYKMWEIAKELGAAEEKKWIYSSFDDYSRISYLGQFDYGFADKYYLSASFRRDGSSKFGPDNRWGNFWSVGATWRLSEEKIIKDLNFVNNLKLRASYGVNGNDGIGSDKYGYLPWQGTYGLDGFYNGQSTAYLDVVGNTSLAWEGNNNANIALEYKVFDRIYGTVEYYNRESDGLLLYKSIPWTTGASTRMENVGKIKNTGWEISLGAQLVDNANFKWDANITYTSNENEILDWCGDNWVGDGQTYRDKGLSMYNLRMRKWAGIDPQTGGPLWYKKIVDENDNPTGKATVTNDWEDGSFYDVGDAAPDFFGAINNNFTYKNLDLSFMFYYSVGNYAYNNVKGMVNSDGAQPRFNLGTEVIDSWKNPGENAENPMYVHNDQSHAWWRSTRFLQRSDFLKLKNLVIGYTLPKRYINRLHLGNARVYVMGENLWTLTDFTGYDPELGLNGDTNGEVVPPMTSITFGVNLTF
ncbi:SusC/RagA family TonB-linked outer membrane protein [Marinilabiliaceae bacterium JC017]|nr:SusC/RagA family TonB-linked outer membrane protein [Marinilabiliaceae bacterium JC017]